MFMDKTESEKYQVKAVVSMLKYVVSGVYPNLNVTFKDYRGGVTECENDERWVGIFVWADRFNQTECMGMYFFGKEDCLDRKYMDLIVFVLSWINGLLFRQIKEFFA